ncbi:biotin transporter BioY [Deinococcus sonorensis]|uniref:Biotin transporter n=2 Tax=Deinococcus sonorensis TaxID=309891 RepID=A0AAU7UEF5_9DEIO
MTQSPVSTRFPTLARAAFPQSRLLTNVLLVLGGALLVALLAQVEVPLYPVPITLQTLGVLLVGAALGARRGALSLASYLALGAVGLPVFAGSSAGLAKLAGPTGGYLLSYVLAAGLVGWLVQRYGLDRRVGGTALAMLAASVVIYSLGLPWLSVVTGLKGTSLLHAGLIPFLIGDALKLGLAALLLPGVWRLLRR